MTAAPSRRGILAAHAAAFALGVVLLAVAQIPNAWAVRADLIGRSPDKVFTGVLPTSAEDTFSYFGWMRQSAEGRFLLEDRFTLEDHPHNYVNLFFGPIGWVAGATGASIGNVYAVSRVLLGAVVILMLWALACLAFSRPGERLACFLLVLIGGGWEGPYNILVRNFGWERVSSPGWWMPEMNTFHSLMTLPHFLAGFICMLGVLFAMLRAWVFVSPPGPVPEGRPWLWASCAGLLLVVLTFFHPYDTVTMTGVIVATPILVGMRERRWTGREIAASAVAMAFLAPAILWNYWLFVDNPAMRAMDLQGIMTTPEASKLALTFGAGGVLAVAALFGLRRMGPVHFAMVAWIATVLVEIQLPLRWQRRMLGGIQIPVAILATCALAWFVVPAAAALARRLFRRPARDAASPRGGWGTLTAVVLMVPIVGATSWYLLDIEWRDLRRFRYPSWINATENDALGALDRLAPEGARVLTSYDMGQLVPGWTASRTFLGHYSLTIDCDAKREVVKKFFDTGTDDLWRQELVRNWRIDSVLYTEHERALGGFDPTGAPWLERVFVAGEGTPVSAAIYAVRERSVQPASTSPAP